MAKSGSTTTSKAVVEVSGDLQLKVTKLTTFHEVKQGGRSMSTWVTTEPTKEILIDLPDVTPDQGLGAVSAALFRMLEMQVDVVRESINNEF